MSEELDVHGRVKVLENSVHKLESRVDDGFRDLAKRLDKVIERPSMPPFKEIITTMVATAAFVYYCLVGGTSWINANTAPMRVELERLASQDKNGEFAVMRYRLQQLENQRIVPKMLALPQQ